MSQASVLLIEDDVSFADMLGRNLRAHGYGVDAVSSVQEAVRRLSGGLRPSIVLLDINLPDGAGWGLLRDPSLARAGSPPVVVVSATTIDPRRLKELGVAGCLPKPFALETLRATIDRLLDQETQER